MRATMPAIRVTMLARRERGVDPMVPSRNESASVSRSQRLPCVVRLGHRQSSRQRDPSPPAATENRAGTRRTVVWRTSRIPAQPPDSPVTTGASQRQMFQPPPIRARQAGTAARNPSPADRTVDRSRTVRSPSRASRALLSGAVRQRAGRHRFELDRTRFTGPIGRVPDAVRLVGSDLAHELRAA